MRIARYPAAMLRLMIAVFACASLPGMGPARADDPGLPLDLPLDLSACAALFDPVGMPSGIDGANGMDYAFRSGAEPPAPSRAFIYRCTAGGFALRLNGVTKVPDWVVENITPGLIGDGAERSDNFFVDPTLPAGYSAQLADYRHSNFDRGHQAPAGDFSGDQQLMDETFVLSNMGPQVGRCFNQGIWRDLETGIRSLVGSRKRLIVFTGPIFEGPLHTIADHKAEMEKHARAARGLPQQPAADSDAPPAPSPAVPDAFYKIVYDPGGGRTIAFRFPNKALCKTSYRERQFLTSVDAIEEETGFDFLPKLPQRDQVMMERETLPAWNW